MSKKNVRMLLFDGTLNSLIKANISDLTMLFSPRDSYHELSEWKESKNWGVYLLISKDKVYIGQAKNLIKRIKDHDKDKKWWNKVILFTNKGNSFNRSHLTYLEKRLIEMSRRLGTLDSSNFQSGNETNIDDYDMNDLEDYLDNVIVLLQLINIDVFSSKERFNKKSSTEKVTKITKKKALELLSQQKINVNDGAITFASIQEKKKLFWANPNVKLLEKKWYIILNNFISRELIVLEIPSNKFNTNLKNNYSLIVRKDKPNRIDLNISDVTLRDYRTKINFTPYIKTKINY